LITHVSSDLINELEEGLATRGVESDDDLTRIRTCWRHFDDTDPDETPDGVVAEEAGYELGAVGYIVRVGCGVNKSWPEHGPCICRIKD
jgi:hypothetical protein